MPGGAWLTQLKGTVEAWVKIDPFNPQTTVSFVINTPLSVRLDIHDAAGRRATTLAEGTYLAGDYQAHWDGRDAAGIEVASGIYFLRFRAGKLIQTQKLVLVR